MAYCVTRIPSSSSSSTYKPDKGNVSRSRASTSGPSGSASSLTKPRSQQELRKDLTKKLNLAGRSMHELQAVLLQESILTGSQSDPCLDPLVSRFSQQINVADSIMLKSTKVSAGTSTSTVPMKEKYHYYLEELQDFDWGKSQYDDFMNATIMEKEKINSAVYEDGGGKSTNYMPLSYFGAEGITPLTTAKSNTNDSDILQENESGCGDFIRSQKTIRPVTEFQKDSCAHAVFDSTTNSFASYSKYSKASFESSDSLELEKSVASVTQVPNRSTQSVRSTSTTASTALFNIGECSDENQLSDLDEDVTDAHKWEALKKKQKSNLRRPRMQDVFPLTEECVASSSSFNQSLDGSPEHSFLHDSRDIPWANKSKSANESWYEFKERCSATSLHQRLRLSETPDRRVEDSASPFKLRDYISDNNVASPCRRSTKSVRFSPSTTIHPSHDRLPYSDSSSDENVSFEVQQFPCTENRRQKLQRNNGRVRLQK
ncbi:unnamed protein product [Orchesella dallaii]|uniref:Uncharacterized protein n=1 Tax=Orchesella dallaii TaxID=48710 RepID=A0ABP1RAC9_9HEXA